MVTKQERPRSFTKPVGLDRSPSSWHRRPSILAAGIGAQRPAAVLIAETEAVMRR